MRILIALVGNALALLATTIVPGILFKGDLLTLLVAGAIFGLFNLIVRPLAMLVSLPLLILTLGLFYFILNAHPALGGVADHPRLHGGGLRPRAHRQPRADGRELAPGRADQEVGCTRVAMASAISVVPAFPPRSPVSFLPSAQHRVHRLAHAVRGVVLAAGGRASWPRTG